MAISRMNSVFAKHHRVIFAVFVVIMIGSFLVFTGPGDNPFSCNASMDCGRVYGQNVTMRELVNQMAFDRLMQPNAAQDDEAAAMQAYQAILLQEMARRRGIQVSDTEVVEVVRMLPFFADKQGNFDVAAYKALLQNWRMTPDAFENNIRNWLLVQKLRQEWTAASMAWSEDELRNFYNYLNEHFIVRVGTFTGDPAAVQVSDEEIADRFKTAPDQFRIPPKVEGAVVKVDLTEPARVAAATKEITPEMLQAYYNTKTYSDRLRDPATGEIPPFDQVRDQVRAMAIREREKLAAQKELRAFLTDVEPLMRSDDRLESFRRIAAEHGLTVIETGKFTENGWSAGAVTDGAVAHELSARTSTSPLTDVIDGKDAEYVGVLLNREPERAAQLDEVKERVRSAVLRDKLLAMAREQGSAELDKLRAMTPEERKAYFADDKAGNFGSALDQPRSALLMNPVFGAKLSSLGADEFTDLIETPAGAMAVYVENRVPADPKGFDSARAELENVLSYYKNRAQEQSLMEEIQGADCRLPNLRRFE